MITRVAGRRIAANPIPYWSRDGRVDKSRAVFDEAFADSAKIGFTAVKADVPDGVDAGEYFDWIGNYGLAPALSLFSSPFDETIDITEEIERAKGFAETQVVLGLDRTMISSMAIPARLAHPAVGADFSRDRLNLAIENCGIICEVLQSQGLRPLHHSHVGGVFETEEEIVALLDGLGRTSSVSELIPVTSGGPESNRRPSSRGTPTGLVAYTSKMSLPITWVATVQSRCHTRT